MTLKKPMDQLQMVKNYLRKQGVDNSRVKKLRSLLEAIEFTQTLMVNLK